MRTKLWFELDTVSLFTMSYIDILSNRFTVVEKRKTEEDDAVFI